MLYTQGVDDGFWYESLEFAYEWLSISAFTEHGGAPQYAVGYSLVHFGGSFRPREAATWYVISSHRYRVLGGPTTVRVVLPVQRRISMPVFSLPQPIASLYTGLWPSCCFNSG